MVGAALCVYWLEPAAWEHERAIEIVQTMALDEWLAIIRGHGYRVALPAEETLVATGSGAGGQVIAVETGSRQFFILPPHAIPALAELLPAADYQALLARAVTADKGEGETT